MRSLDKHLEANSQRFHRICTGEFTDSLALDPITGLAQDLVNFFSGRDGASLEIKTKTDFIEPLLGMRPKGRVVLSFSVNSREITRIEEIRAAPLERRLASAARAQDCGYRIGFHFDPIIPIRSWQEAYSRVIDNIFELVRPSAIAWISMGILRFVPDLKEIAGARFGRIPYFHDGFLRGRDGKNRLHVDRRIRMYRSLADEDTPVLSGRPDLPVHGISIRVGGISGHKYGIRSRSGGVPQMPQCHSSMPSWNTHTVITRTALSAAKIPRLDDSIPVIALEAFLPLARKSLQNLLKWYYELLDRKVQGVTSKRGKVAEIPKEILTTGDFLAALKLNVSQPLHYVRALTPEEISPDTPHDPSRSGPPGGMCSRDPTTGDDSGKRGFLHVFR